MHSPVLTLLRRLEAQNVWRMTCNVMPQQTITTAALAQVDDASTSGTTGESMGYHGVCTCCVSMLRPAGLPNLFPLAVAAALSF